MPSTHTVDVDRAVAPGSLAARMPKRRLTADARRAQLTNVALHLFASRGFGGTTTKAIAEAAGVSEGIIFRHFATKDELYAAILEERARLDNFDATLDALRNVARTGDDASLVRQVVQLTLDAYRRNPDFHRMMLYAALEGHDLAKASQRVLGTPVFAFFRDYVRSRQAAGAFRDGPAELLVFGLLALPIHFAMSTTLFDLQQINVSDDVLIDTFTRIILNGVQADRTPRPAPRATRASRPRQEHSI